MITVWFESYHVLVEQIRIPSQAYNNTSDEKQEDVHRTELKQQASLHRCCSSDLPAEKYYPCNTHHVSCNRTVKPCIIELCALPSPSPYPIPIPIPFPIPFPPPYTRIICYPIPGIS